MPFALPVLLLHFLLLELFYLWQVGTCFRTLFKKCNPTSFQNFVLLSTHLPFKALLKLFTLFYPSFFKFYLATLTLLLFIHHATSAMPSSPSSSNAHPPFSLVSAPLQRTPSSTSEKVDKIIHDSSPAPHKEIFDKNNISRTDVAATKLAVQDSIQEVGLSAYAEEEVNKTEKDRLQDFKADNE